MFYPSSLLPKATLQPVSPTARHVLIVAEITGCGGMRKDHFLSKELDVRQGLIDLLNTSQWSQQTAVLMILMEVQAVMAAEVLNIR